MTPTLDAALLCSSRAGSDLGRESGLVWGALFTWCNVPIMGPYIQVESLGLHIIVFMIIGRPIVIAISQFNSCNTKKIKHTRWSNLEMCLTCLVSLWSGPSFQTNSLFLHFSAFIWYWISQKRQFILSTSLLCHRLMAGHTPQNYII